MRENRILDHPILSVPDQEEITFYWNSKPLKAKQGEVISSALFANNIKIFGHHPVQISKLLLFYTKLLEFLLS